MIAWVIVGILGILAAWVALAIVAGVLKVILALVRKPDP